MCVSARVCKVACIAISHLAKRSDGIAHVPVTLQCERNARGTSRGLSQQAAPVHGEGPHRQPRSSNVRVDVWHVYRQQERGLQIPLPTASVR
jgi:hypothetical protein